MPNILPWMFIMYFYTTYTLKYCPFAASSTIEVRAQKFFGFKIERDAMKL